MRACVHADKHVYACIHVHAHTHTCTHTHTTTACLAGAAGLPAYLPTCIHMRTLIQSFTSSLIHTPQSESNMSGLQCSTFTDRRVRFGRTALKPNPNAYARTRLRATGAAAEEPVPALNEDGWARCCMIVMRASRLLTSDLTSRVLRPQNAEAAVVACGAVCTKEIVLYVYAHCHRIEDVGLSHAFTWKL